MKQIIQKNDGLASIADFIRNNDDFIIIGHISPDGDTLGSSLALYNTMRAQGKKVQVVCQDRVPQILLFLQGAYDVICPDKAVRAENVIAVDCADITRLGKAENLFNAAKTTVCIDHHGTNTRYANINEIHAHCSATGEIIYELLRLYTGTVTAKVADCLYTAVMTDTGCFSYNNVNAQSFETAAELVKLGADSARANLLVYKTVPFQKTKLLGYALSSTELFFGGKIGFCHISQLDLARFKAKAEDTEGIIDYIRDIDTVEIAIFIRECLDGQYKVSLRSKEYVDVAQLAQCFGGGGHMYAAGFKIDMKLERLRSLIISEAENMLRQEEE